MSLKNRLKGCSLSFSWTCCWCLFVWQSWWFWSTTTQKVVEFLWESGSSVFSFCTSQGAHTSWLRFGWLETITATSFITTVQRLYWQMAAWLFGCFMGTTCFIVIKTTAIILIRRPSSTLLCLLFCSLGISYASCTLWFCLLCRASTWQYENKQRQTALMQVELFKHKYLWFCRA